MTKITKTAQRELDKAAYVAKRIADSARDYADFKAKKFGGVAADFLAECIANKTSEASIFEVQFDRQNPVPAAKSPTAKKMSFKAWFANADMPQQDKNGNWCDLEDGIAY